MGDLDDERRQAEWFNTNYLAPEDVIEVGQMPGQMVNKRLFSEELFL